MTRATTAVIIPHLHKIRPCHLHTNSSFKPDSVKIESLVHKNKTSRLRVAAFAHFCSIKYSLHGRNFKYCTFKKKTNCVRATRSPTGVESNFLVGMAVKGFKVLREARVRVQ